MFEHIDLMLADAENGLATLKATYHANLAAKTVSPELCNQVRKLLSDLRDPLDHVYRLIPGSSPNGYFPIANGLSHFSNMTSGIPSDITDILLRYQSFRGSEWIKQLSALSNIHKHIKLVPQIRKEQTVTVVTPVVPIQNSSVSFGSPGSGFFFKPGEPGFISFLPGGGVQYSGVTFTGQTAINGVPINTRSQQPVPSTTQKTEVQVWIDFLFDPNDGEIIRKLGAGTAIHVLPFLEESLRKVKEIIESLKVVGLGNTRTHAPVP